MWKVYPPGTFSAEHDDRLYWGRCRSAYTKLVDKDAQKKQANKKQPKQEKTKAEEAPKEQQIKERNKNMIDNFIKIIEIHMRVILKFKYVFTSKIYF